MKLWQTALAVTVVGTVAYVGYRVVKRMTLEGPAIQENNAIDPKEQPIAEKVAEKIAEKVPVRKPDMRLSRDIPSLRGDISITRFQSRDPDSAPSFLPVLPIDTRTPAQRVAALFRESNTPAEYDIFGNRIR